MRSCVEKGDVLGWTPSSNAAPAWGVAWRFLLDRATLRHGYTKKIYCGLLFAFICHYSLVISVVEYGHIFCFFCFSLLSRFQSGFQHRCEALFSFLCCRKKAWRWFCRFTNDAFTDSFYPFGLTCWSFIAIF